MTQPAEETSASHGGEPEKQKNHVSPTRRRKLLAPPRLVGWLLPLATTGLAISAVFAVVSGGGERILALVTVVPMTTLVVSTLRVALPRLRQEWTKERALRRAQRGPLEPLVGRTRKVVLVGALRATAPLVSDGSPCVAYVRRKELPSGQIEQLSDVAPCALHTEDAGVIPLENGVWQLSSPFSTFDASCTARLVDGAQVVVRARLSSHRVAGAVGYRDGKLETALRARGGWIAPVEGYAVSRSEIDPPWKSRAIMHAVLATLVGFAAGLISQASSRPSHERPAPRVALSPSGAPTTDSGACKPDRSCDAPKVCDAETNSCVDAVAGRLAEGAGCSKPGDCQAGLRCRRELNVEGGRRCVAPCRSDRECGAGRYCVPCMTKPLDVDGDCVERSRISGAVSAVCEMLHGNSDDAPPASPSGTVAPAAPAVSSSSSSSSSPAAR